MFYSSGGKSIFFYSRGGRFGKCFTPAGVFNAVSRRIISISRHLIQRFFFGPTLRAMASMIPTPRAVLDEEPSAPGPDDGAGARAAGPDDGAGGMVAGSMTAGGICAPLE